jgi:hypothetical protein
MAAEERLPGYFARKPLYPPVTALRETLGFQDAAIQLTALAIEVLEETSAAAREGAAAFLRDGFYRHQIPRGSHNLGDARRLAGNSYIVQTHHIAEEFFREMIRAYRQFARPAERWRTQGRDGSELDGLTQLITNLPASGVSLLKGAPETALLQYYRLVRTSVIHPSAETANRAERAYRSLVEESGEHIKRCYSDLSAPNRPREITFHDFRLYTRALKFYANLVNDACDLTLAQIADALFRDSEFRPRLLQSRTSPSRIGNAIRHASKTRHSLNKDQVREVAERLFSAVQELPTARERKRAAQRARTTGRTKRR